MKILEFRVKRINISSFYFISRRYLTSFRLKNFKNFCLVKKGLRLLVSFSISAQQLSVRNHTLNRSHGKD